MPWSRKHQGKTKIQENTHEKGYLLKFKDITEDIVETKEGDSMYVSN